MPGLDALLAIKELPPNLRLLLKRVGVVERMQMGELLTMIMSHTEGRDTAYHLAVFCANYFAQAATLHGHDAACHGKGAETVQSVTNAMLTNTRAYELSMLIGNDNRMSEDPVEK